MIQSFSSVFELNAYLKKVEDERKVARRERKLAYFKNQLEWAEIRQRNDPYLIQPSKTTNAKAVKAE
jgi:hypothetical protein